MCVEYNRRRSDELEQETGTINAYDRRSILMSDEGDDDRTLTYREFIAAAMINR